MPDEPTTSRFSGCGPRHGSDAVPLRMISARTSVFHGPGLPFAFAKCSVDLPLGPGECLVAIRLATVC